MGVPDSLHVGDHHLRARLHEQLGLGSTLASCTPRDQRDLVVESVHRRSSLVVEQTAMHERATANG